MTEKGTIEYLAYLLNNAKIENKDKAIVFLGAGVSVSAGIPIADVIVRHIRFKFRKNPLFKKYKLKGAEDYYNLMGLLTADERRDLFHFYVTREKVKLNIANVYLAQLLKEGYVDYIVTVNFDDLILKACTLFNFLPPVYDISNIKTTTTTDIRTGSVIYLHGQYFGQWLLNNKEELTEVEKEVLSFFNAIKTRRTWIIVGYSGNDGIFEKIKSLGSFSNELFWIKKKLEPKTDDHINTFINTAKVNAHSIEGYYADSFFLKLHAELSKLNDKLNHPDIFHKPFSYLKSVIGNVNDIQDDDELHKQVKAIINVSKDRIEKAINSLENVDSIEDFKQEIIDAIIKQNFNEATAKRFSEEINKKGFLEAKEELSWYFNDWGNSIMEEAKANPTENLFYECIQKYKKANQLNSKNDVILYNWGNALLHLSRLKSNEGLYHECFEKFKEATIINPENELAFMSWGNALNDLATLTSNEEFNNQSISKFEIAAKINPNNYATFYNWGNVLYNLARAKSNKELYKKCFEKYKISTELNQNYDGAFVNWGAALIDLTALDSDESIIIESIEKFEHAFKIDPKNQNTFVNWGNALQELAKLKSDEELFKKSFEKYEIATKLNPNSFEAFTNWGNAIQSLAQLRSDINIYKESLEKYSVAEKINSNDAVLYDNWSNSLLSFYHIANEDKIEILKDALKKAQKTYNLNPKRPYNLSCCYSLLLDKENALKFLEETLKTKLISIKHINEDKDWDNMREDEDFKNLIAKYKIQ